MILTNKHSKHKISKVLYSIFGIGKRRSAYICKKFGYQRNAVILNLGGLELAKLKTYVEHNFIINKFLKQNISKNINLLIKLGIYKGKRHKLGYPVRGQRTLSNGKTQKKLYRNRFFNRNLKSFGSVNFNKRFNSIKKKKKNFKFKNKRR